VFCDAEPTSPKTREFLDLLKKAERGNRRGELVARNLEFEPNVPEPVRKEFVRYVESMDAPNGPDDAARLYASTVYELEGGDYTFDSGHNEPNRAPAPPFAALERAVDVGSFAVYNLGLTRDKAERPELRAQIARRLTGTAGPPVRSDMLRGEVGGNCVWATEASVLASSEPTADGGPEPDELRDALGLDDPERYGRDESMVLFSYSNERVPGRAFYRPTVLQAGWAPCAGAFLPSDPESHTGWTQNLATGARGKPEIVHAPFSAREIDGLDVAGPLARDPSTGYRDVRLA